MPGFDKYLKTLEYTATAETSVKSLYKGYLTWLQEQEELKDRQQTASELLYQLKIINEFFIYNFGLLGPFLEPGKLLSSFELPAVENKNDTIKTAINDYDAQMRTKNSGSYDKVKDSKRPMLEAGIFPFLTVCVAGGIVTGLTYLALFVQSAILAASVGMVGGLALGTTWFVYALLALVSTIGLIGFGVNEYPYIHQSRIRAAEARAIKSQPDNPEDYSELLLAVKGETFGTMVFTNDIDKRTKDDKDLTDCISATSKSVLWGFDNSARSVLGWKRDHGKEEAANQIVDIKDVSRRLP